MAKSLLKLSKQVKKSIIIPKFFSSGQFYNYSVPGLGKNKLATRSDVFVLLREDKNPLSLLANIQANKEIIDGRHVVAAMTSAQKFYAMNAISPSVVHKNEHFQKLCSILSSYITKLDIPNIIQALKVLNLLQVPSSTMIMQSILQIIRNSVNSLSLDQIYYLTFLLEQMKSTHLSDALLEALPEVFIAQLELQLDKEDLSELINTLRYASNHIENKQVIKFIIDTLENYQEEIDSKSAFSILWSLLTIKDLPDGYLNLLEKVQEILIDNKNQFKESEVMKILSKLFVKIIKKEDGFYNFVLIDKFVNQLIENNCGFDKGTVVLNLLNKLKHINIPLLNYLSSECSKNSSVLLGSHPLSIVELVSGLALANYKPHCWDELKKAIIEHDSKNLDDPTFCYFNLYLASLNCFDYNLLARVFSADKNPSFMSISYLKTLQKLYRSVKILYPEYTGPWPSDAIIDSFKNMNLLDKLKPLPLLSVLEKILGDPRFIKNNVKTDLGFEIDHLIVLENNSPIPIESKTSTDDKHFSININDLIIPANSKRIALLVFSSESYSRNIERLPAVEMMNIKALEAMSYKVVHVSMELWKRTPDGERLPFLQTLIGVGESNKFSF